MWLLEGPWGNQHGFCSEKTVGRQKNWEHVVSAKIKERIRSQLWLVFLVRTVMNTAFRIIYPFLPSLARGLGISLTAASGLVTLRMVAGMGAPFLGPLADRHDRRRMMEIALLILHWPVCYWLV